MLKRFMKKKPNEILKEESEGFEIDENNIPKHIAIIMDGNGRWAKKRNLPRTFGHKAGVETVRKILVEARKLGVKYLTLYAFSTENWKRPKDEVGALMKLFIQSLQQEVDELDKNGVAIKFIGDISKLPKDCISAIDKAVNRTKDNNVITLNIALNYGGRDEITRTFKILASKAVNGSISLEDINEEMIAAHLDTARMPDPDIIIRPSGEQRLSNFLLWQCAYSEFWMSNILWPDFTEKDLRKAIYDYQNRDRRYGGV